MKREICSEEKIVYYWMSQKEKIDPTLQTSLRPEYAQWRKMRYKICVFTSGTENLVDLTKELLSHNKQNATDA